ncbi:hypothetical protein HZF08_38515 [Paenibacillus sp. CGMCC 1.16610]|uniref:Uncharacterized protein n=1 Tax=Paenibacillus anseongense TaxID=2682845 RepID=A0ABW9UFV5_9BACL|nr:hypothetical protein [Paenibacillus sp. CGMCC 1.16610]MVQ38063.1 hypothetical protein [Paenibacillus anseongense]
MTESDGLFCLFAVTHAENKGTCGRYFGKISRFRMLAELQGFICLPISVFLAKPEK